MASFHQYHNRLNQVHDSSSCNTRHGFSKAQACLNKILHTISFSKPCDTSKESSLKPQIDGFSAESTALCRRTRGFDIDLNLRLDPFPETEEEYESPTGEGGLSACSAVGETVESNSPAVSVGVLTAEKCLEGEFEANCASVKANHEDVIRTEVSEITNSQVRSLESDNNGVSGEESKIIAEDHENHNDAEIHVGEVKSKECRSEGFLGLLIEAAKLISGEFEDEEPVPESPSQEKGEGIGNELSTHATIETEVAEKTKGSGSRSKRKHCEMMADLYGDFGDISPVVRSKRGRSQVLPYRYRDSVIEPWKRSSKQRSTVVSTKRRSR